MIEVVFAEPFDKSKETARAAVTALGFAIDETAMPPGNTVKMSIWQCTKGNKLLSMFLGFLFKSESLYVQMTGYQDGTTAFMVYDGGTTGGNTMSAVGGAALGSAGSALGSAADSANKDKERSKNVADLNAKLREQLRVAYEGKPGPNAMPLMA